MRVEFVCPACQRVVLAPPSLEGTSADCPKCNATVPRWPEPRARGGFRPSPRVYVLIAACSAAAILAVAFVVFFWLSSRSPVEAVPASFPNEDWILSCHVTGSGEPSADEGFSGPALEGYNRNRGAGYVERVYPGTRVWVVVIVSRGGSGVGPGRYKLYGTVTGLDLSSRRASLTNCVFAPPK